MRLLTTTALTMALSSILFSASAQEDSVTIAITKTPATMAPEGKVPMRKPYWGNSLDGMVFSTALINDNGNKSLGTLRFSMFFHIGATYNYNFSKNAGIYTGLDLKNIGFIEKFKLNDATVKQRVYTLGLPVGLRFGNMNDRSYFFIGGGLDVAIHYKEKMWSDLMKKQKSYEWFSDKTEILMPYIFAGVALKGTTIKVQYYPTNFLNEDYTASGTSIKLNAGKKVNLLLVSVGRDMKFGKKK